MHSFLGPNKPPTSAMQDSTGVAVASRITRLCYPPCPHPVAPRARGAGAKRLARPRTRIPLPDTISALLFPVQYLGSQGNGYRLGSFACITAYAGVYDAIHLLLAGWKTKSRVYGDVIMMDDPCTIPEKGISRPFRRIRNDYKTRFGNRTTETIPGTSYPWSNRYHYGNWNFQR